MTFAVAAPASRADHEWLESVVARVQRRHPEAPPWLVERSVRDVARQLDGAGVHLYLPILVERRGALTVKTVLAGDGGTPSTHPEDNS